MRGASLSVGRYEIFDALVLKSYPIGDLHRGVVFLTRQRGLVSAIAHGAAASKGRSKLLTTPLRQVTGSFYHDPVKDDWKVGELGEKALFPGLAEDLGKFFAASLWAETILASHAAGPSDELFQLAVDALTALEAQPAARIDFLMIQFLWRFLEIQGLAPDFHFCRLCGASIEGKTAFYHLEEDGLECETCARSAGPFWSAGGLRYLQKSLEQEFFEALRLSCDADSARLLKASAYGAIQKALGHGLKSLKSGQGIL